MTGTRESRSPGVGARASWLSMALLLAACAVNPATGKRQLSLIGEAQEIQMGREAAASVQTTVGLVDDQRLQEYVAAIGRQEAAISERPSLPWEFHVVDDPSPNAFALPGGFIYVTRGMLALMTSEAELAGVLGHEIGHVTARHSVNQISKQQLAQVGFGLGAIFLPGTQPIQSLLGAGLDLLFLKYGRDDEREADELGFGYMRRRNYDVGEFDDVFAALDRLGDEQAGALPAWLSTHPAPAERVQTAQARIAAVGPQPNARVGHEEYLRRIDGLVYGKDPRQGFFRETTFYHPALKFQLTFPAGWQTQNLTQAVIAVAPENRALLQLTLAGNLSPDAAMQRFFAQSGATAGRAVQMEIHGAPAVLAEFEAQTEGGVIRGQVAYVSRNGVTFQLVGYTAASLYASYAASIEQAIRSLAPVTDPAILNVQPQRIDIVTVPRTMTLDEFARQNGSAVPAATLAILNGLAGSAARLDQGSLVKSVR